MKITGETDWMCDLPDKEYSIELKPKPMYHAEFGGSGQWFHRKKDAVKYLAWKIYWHNHTTEKGQGYYCMGEFIVDPSYETIEPDGCTAADRRREVNGIARYQLGYEKLIYPANLICSDCGAPYYYDECGTETRYLNDEGREYPDGVDHYPDKAKCHHACSCDADLVNRKK